MDEEYNDSVDTSTDMDVSDVDVSYDIPADIPDDIPEDMSEADYSDADVADDSSEDVTEETATDDVEYDETDEFGEEDSIESETEEFDELIDDIEEDTLEESEKVSDDYGESDDVPEDTEVFDKELEDEFAETEDIPEDTDNTEMADQTETFEEDIPEDVADAEATDEATDAENDDTTEQPENVTNSETTEESTDAEDVDASEQSDNQGDLETYDYETSPETQDAVNPETLGKFVSAEKPYREKWEHFGEEFLDEDQNLDCWNSLKDVPFSGETKSDTAVGADDTELTDVNPLKQPDIEKPPDATEINSISDYMNAHNYGSDDFAIYSQDPQWRQLMRQEHPDYELPKMTQESANAQLSQYMNDHSYGVDDYAEYSQDPIWRELHSTAFPNDNLPFLSGKTGNQNIEYSSATDDDGGDMNPSGNGSDGGQNPPHDLDDVAEGEMFGSFETDKNINGSDSFIKGENYQQFKKDYYSPKGSTYEAYDTPKEVDISPSMIEGIHLGEGEIKNPSVFWSQHEREGSLESFKKIANRIPDVREQLASGKTMDELLTDPELSECAGIYFANKPKVIENDGYYEFDSNGRHRILAAREAGYDIPVEVIGRRDRNDGIDVKNIDSAEEKLYANFREELSEQNARDDKELGSFADKIRNFFTPSVDTDLAEPRADDVNYSNQDMQEKWTPPAIKGVDVKESAADITPLDVTRQSINTIDLPDGSKAKIFDHPNNLRNILPFSQGKNEYSKNGTCALADTGAWLKVAGSKHVENDVVGFASTHSDRHGQPLCSKSGGTLPSNIPDIWEHFGMPAYSDSSKNLESIAEAVESGRAVSVVVNAGTLWEQDNAEKIRIPQNCYGDGGANHAIGVMSCERDLVSGNITHFYINDTGRTYERDACRRIRIDNFWKSFNVKRACATISQKPIW